MARWIVLTTPWTFNRGTPSEQTFGMGRKVRVHDETAEQLFAASAARAPLASDIFRAVPVDLTAG